MAAAVPFDCAFLQADDDAFMTGAWNRVDCVPGPGRIAEEYGDDANNYENNIVSRSLQLVCNSFDGEAVNNQDLTIRTLKDDATTEQKDFELPLAAGSAIYFRVLLEHYWNQMTFQVRDGSFRDIIYYRIGSSNDTTGAAGLDGVHAFKFDLNAAGAVDSQVIQIYEILGHVPGRDTERRPVEVMFYVRRQVTYGGTDYWEIEVWLRHSQTTGLFGTGWMHMGNGYNQSTNASIFAELRQEPNPGTVAASDAFDDAPKTYLDRIRFTTETVDAETGLGELHDPALTTGNRCHVLSRIHFTNKTPSDTQFSSTNGGMQCHVMGLVPRIPRVWTLIRDAISQPDDSSDDQGGCVRFWKSDVTGWTMWDEVQPSGSVLIVNDVGVYQYPWSSGVADGEIIVAVGTQQTIAAAGTGVEKIQYRRSTNGGDTWGALTELVAAGAAGAIRRAERPGTVLTDGRFVIPYRNTTDLWFAVSSDQGATWSLVDSELTAASGVMVTSTPDGRVLAMKADNNAFHLHYAYAADPDDLTTWGAWALADGQGGRPLLYNTSTAGAALTTFFLGMMEGKLYVAYHHDASGYLESKNHTLYLFESDDSGATWTEVPYYSHLFTGSGYPNPFVFQDGRDLIVSGSSNNTGGGNAAIMFRVPNFFGPATFGELRPSSLRPSLR